MVSDTLRLRLQVCTPRRRHTRSLTRSKGGKQQSEPFSKELRSPGLTDLRIKKTLQGTGGCGRCGGCQGIVVAGLKFRGLFQPSFNKSFNSENSSSIPTLLLQSIKQTSLICDCIFGCDCNLAARKAERCGEASLHFSTRKMVRGPPRSRRSASTRRRSAPCRLMWCRSPWSASHLRLPRA